MLAADNAGMNVVHEALFEYRRGNFSFSEDLEYEDELEPATASITFNPAAGVPYSTNNLSQSTAVTGWDNTLVPPNSVHLVAVCHSGVQHRVFEQIYSFSVFPWSVASNGSITGNDMEVFGISESTVAYDGIQDNEKEKSDILSNSPTGSTPGSTNSIFLTGNSLVSGDATAVGNVSALAPSEILGDRFEGSQYEKVITVPKRAADYEPNPSDTLAYGPTIDKLSGLYEVTGDTNIGDLTFDDGMLYVRGNAIITGTIKGTGAIVAEGDITVTGSMETASDLAALVAGGDIKINGDGVNTSSFQGLVLAEGSFEAKDTQIIGAVVSLASDGNVNLERVRAINAQDLTRIDIKYAKELKRATQSNAGIRGSEVVGVLYDGEFVPLSPQYYGALEALALQAIGDGENDALVKIRKEEPADSGNYIYSETPSGALLDAFYTGLDAWSNYGQQVETNTVEYEEIFQLDFNKFLRDDASRRLLFQNSTLLSQYE